MSRPRKPIPAFPSQSGPIAFRLEPEWLEPLDACAQSEGVSRHELARQWVKERIERTENLPDWEAIIAVLFENLHQLRQDLALGFEALLTHAGKVPAEKAQDWANRNYRNPPQPAASQEPRDTATPPLNKAL